MIHPVFFQDASEFLNWYDRRTEECQDQWKKDHVEAMNCFRLEELVAFGLSIYHFLNRIDEAWRIKVHKKLVGFDHKVEERLISLYRSWLRLSRRLKESISRFEKAKFDVVGADEFRGACREVQGILTQDSDFFADQEFRKLQNEAAKEHSARKTEKFRSLRD